MPTANGAGIGAACVRPEPPRASAMLSLWWSHRCCVTPLDELPPLRVWCSECIRTAAIEPDVVLTAGVTSSSNYLSAARVKDLDGFTLGPIACGLGVDLELEAADLSGLLRGELELELQPVGVTTTANDEGARNRIQTEVADAVDSSHAIKVDGDDLTVFWARAKANSLHAGVISQLLKGEALRRGPGLDQGVFVGTARQQATALVDERLAQKQLRLQWLWSLHNWGQEFSDFPRLQPGDFFCSVLRQPFQALLDERADEATAARACLLHGVIQLADQTGSSTNR